MGQSQFLGHKIAELISASAEHQISHRVDVNNIEGLFLERAVMELCDGGLECERFCSEDQVLAAGAFFFFPSGFSILRLPLVNVSSRHVSREVTARLIAN